ncbi:ATP-binding cassette subfamily F protein uup [Dysgonomonadaceae bacterium PH5-43]|nr:ATP-binding cassette subfamily F protein uup [Dysgonomonadaceae bacterium PH5-43]
MTPYLQIDNLTKSFGDLILFQDISFGVAEGDRIGLIAKNGTGKTTLLNIIAGKEDYDAGNIVFRRDLRIGYLNQNPEYPSEITVLQACANSGNELRAKQILTKLKITNLEQKIGELSGGQLKRVALAEVLITEPDFLILDEPTNHLDLEMTEWLEGYLSRSNITLLMVTHDRYFLDRVCNEIIEIENKELFQYKGNYNYYLEKRQERLDARSTELDRANNLFKKELEWMRRQPQARATKAKSRIDSFYELEKKVQQEKAQGNVKLAVNSSYIGNKIFEAKSVYKSFDNLKILENFNYTFSRYEKMGIVGNNGTGKSTFIKLLVGEVQPDKGAFDIGETVKFGYYSQDGLQFDEQMKVIDAVRDIAEVIDLGGGNQLTASQFLQHFLFKPEKQYDYIHKLSGGEKRRLYLCTVLIKNPNFLILDEPTNDLDIVTLNVLEEYLASFKGCVIVVSHDRYFMDKVVDHLLVFKGNGEVKDFPGNYTIYRDWKDEQEKETVKKEKEVQDKRNIKKTSEKTKLTFKEKRELECLEQEIADLEEEQTKLEKELSSGTLSNDDLVLKSQRISEIIELLDEKSLRWLELSDI